MGALYASGLSAKDIVELTMVEQSTSFSDLMKNKDLGAMLKLIDPDLGWNSQGLLRGERFLEFLYDGLAVKTFEELAIPFKCVATDFWRYAPVIFDAGDLSIADFAIWPWIVPWEMQGQNLAELPNVMAWYERCAAREGFQKGFALGLELRQTLSEDSEEAEKARKILFGQKAR